MGMFDMTRKVAGGTSRKENTLRNLDQTKTHSTTMNRRNFLATAGMAAGGFAAAGAGAANSAEEPAAASVPVSLDDLATAWLRRRITRPAAMPGLCNDLGALQIEADIAAIKHPVFPPYSGGNEITALTLLDGRSLAQATPHVEIRWRAFEVERRCDAGGWHLESRTSLLPEQPGAVVRIRVENRHGALGGCASASCFPAAR